MAYYATTMTKSKRPARMQKKRELPWYERHPRIAGYSILVGLVALIGGCVVLVAVPSPTDEEPTEVPQRQAPLVDYCKEPQRFEGTDDELAQLLRECTNTFPDP